MTDKSPSGKPKTYRFPTGEDDAAFCQRVSDALHNGYVLFSPPLLQLGALGSRLCRQANVLPEFASAKKAVTDSEN